ncbi:MAG: hypothetical protein ABII06_04705 [Pseudomonadota bacterium]
MRHRTKTGKSYSLTPGLVADVKALANNLARPESWVAQHALELYVAMIRGRDPSLFKRPDRPEKEAELPLKEKV